MATPAKIWDRIEKLEAKARSTAFAPEAAALRAKAAELRAAVEAELAQTDPAASARPRRKPRATASRAKSGRSTVRGAYPYSVLFSSSAGG